MNKIIKKTITRVLSLSIISTHFFSTANLTYAKELSGSYIYNSQEVISNELNANISKEEIENNINEIASDMVDVIIETSAIEDTEPIVEDVVEDVVEIPGITTINLPYYSSYKGFKSYMGYNMLTDKNSAQYQLQLNAYTGNYGIRMINGRYMVAIGSYFGLRIGDEFDIILENGTIIPAIMGDLKDNKDTDSNNVYTVATNCCTEFIVDTGSYEFKQYKNMGDVSYACEEWNSKVVAIQFVN